MLKHYPLIGITIAFVLGIIAESVFQISFIFLGTTFIGSIALSILFWRWIKKQSKEIPTFIYASLSVFLFGMLLFQFQNRVEVKYPLPQQFVKDVKMVGRISSIEIKRENDFKFKIETDSVITDSNKIAGQFTIICRVKTDGKKGFLNLYYKLNPGNVVSIKGVYNKGKGTRNPGEFDYQAYLLKQGVTGFLSVKNPEDVKILDYDKSTFSSWLFSIRKNIADKIDELQQPQTVGLIKG
ncbi:MAG: DUF4131 domain-containing protein, partial [Ignavibacteriaceae bacterium]|nr:DUF4131 domain-containing protein [Ignavibacteriaceae bacterium]